MVLDPHTLSFSEMCHQQKQSWTAGQASEARLGLVGWTCRGRAGGFSSECSGNPCLGPRGHAGQGSRPVVCLAAGCARHSRDLISSPRKCRHVG